MNDLRYKFLEMLDDFDYDIFDLKMIRDTTYFSDKEITNALKTLCKSGTIIKIEQGKYIRNSFNESFVIGNFLASDGGIAYWSALNAYGLTEQFPNVIFVQTAKRKGEVIFRNLRYKFVKVDSRKLTGYKTLGFGNHQYIMSDIEKTMVDCFDLPQYAGWYHESIKAFNKAKLSPTKLIQYCKTIDNISVTKRLGYLCELLNKPKMQKFIDYAQASLKDSYSLFEIGGENKGEYVKRWKLILNMPEEEILEIANS